MERVFGDKEWVTSMYRAHRLGFNPNRNEWGPFRMEVLKAWMVNEVRVKRHGDKSVSDLQGYAYNLLRPGSRTRQEYDDYMERRQESERERREREGFEYEPSEGEKSEREALRAEYERYEAESRREMQRQREREKRLAAAAERDRLRNEEQQLWGVTYQPTEEEREEAAWRRQWTQDCQDDDGNDGYTDGGTAADDDGQQDGHDEHEGDGTAADDDGKQDWHDEHEDDGADGYTDGGTAADDDGKQDWHDEHEDDGKRECGGNVAGAGGDDGNVDRPYTENQTIHVPDNVNWDRLIHSTNEDWSPEDERGRRYYLRNDYLLGSHKDDVDCPYMENGTLHAPDNADREMLMCSPDEDWGPEDERGRRYYLHDNYMAGSHKDEDFRPYLENGSLYAPEFADWDRIASSADEDWGPEDENGRRYYIHDNYMSDYSRCHYA